jgi:hypothetical protein
MQAIGNGKLLEVQPEALNREDSANHIYTVIIVPDYEYPRTEKSAVTVLARIVDDTVIIEEDITDRPLYQELMRAGVPREKIVLAYAGEQLPSQV